ncbi:MAG: S1 family peptidase [Solirubrobacterales bacterium]
MKRMIIAGACAAAAVAIGTALASAFSGKSGLYGLSTPSSSAPAATTPGSSGSLFALEQAVLTRQGISPARAYQAIGVQSTIAQSGLVSEVESTMADTYGGMWFEPATAQLHIGVTSPASRRTAEGIVARAGLAADVTETPVRSTWAQLLAAQEQWGRKLANLLARTQAQTALAPQSNAVVVTLSSSVPSPERSVLEREASTAGVNIVVTVVPRSQLTTTPESMPTVCNAFARNAALCNKTLTSGVTIKALVAGTTKEAACTAGPMAIPNANKNETYLLTAGHCISKTGGIGVTWYAFNTKREANAIGPAEEAVFNTKGDVGAIKIKNPGYWVNTGNDPVYADTAEWSKNNPEMSYPVKGERSSVVGYTNCHEGQTSGQQCGIVTKLGVEVNYGSEGGIVKGLVKDTAVTEPGDSGGPWLFITTKANGALMEGVLSGGGGETTKTPSYYEPLGEGLKLLTKLNLELLTTANEVR